MLTAADFGAIKVAVGPVRPRDLGSGTFGPETEDDFHICHKK